MALLGGLLLENKDTTQHEYQQHRAGGIAAQGQTAVVNRLVQEITQDCA